MTILSHDTVRRGLLFCGTLVILVGGPGGTSYAASGTLHDKLALLFGRNVSPAEEAWTDARGLFDSPVCTSVAPTKVAAAVDNASPKLAGAFRLSQVQAPAPAQTPTSPTIACANPGENFINPPELVSSPDHVLRGTVALTVEAQRIPRSTKGGTPTCAPQLVRAFRGRGLAPSPAAQPANANYLDPMAGPTLRASVGDLVQLAFVNEVNPNRFDRNIDLEACQTVGQKGVIYPGGVKDVYPNCLHASSTANLHFHGTHTYPDATADNVYLQIRPLPRDNQGNLTTTPEQASVGFDDFFKTCKTQLANPLNWWPRSWNDLPQPWIAKQTELLQAYEKANPSQPLWTKDNDVKNAGGWPQYYIGAYPYCFALPAYTAPNFPPPAGSTSPIMGQSPGTHWYHAHKHGSTAINVANGMVGVFIIEGEYDEALNRAYSSYVLNGNKPWNTRSQPVMVLNQLGTTPNLLTATHSGAGPAGIDFTINGRVRPVVQMQPGEIQLWRILNASSRNAAYFMAPEGFQWRQLAQDGVQFADANYQGSLNHPFYMAPGNRVDLLVQAPMQSTNAKVLIQQVMGRSEVAPSPLTPAEPPVGTVLMSINVSGPPVMLNGAPSQMDFIRRAPEQPKFLTNITNSEWKKSNYATQSLEFGSLGPGNAIQHTINGIQFQDNKAIVNVMLSAVQQWTIKNTTNGVTGPGVIDHPFHIHINPFQITEVFDPNEQLTDPKTGKLIAVLDAQNKTQTVPRYVTNAADFSKVDAYKKRQCLLNPSDATTWKPCSAGSSYTPMIWWDVFAIPSARVPTDANGDPINDPAGNPIVIPGYFTMRSRFVDYPGLYVLHCHILVHEDRGMMYSVQVMPPPHIMVTHH